MDLEKVIIEKAIARTMFVTAWADEMEEQGKSFAPQQEIMSVAPSTPSVAIKEAYRFVGALENQNHMMISTLIHQAAKADGLTIDSMEESQLAEYAREFGHYMSMEAMGHGVSWFDDHKEFKINIPDYENPLLGDPSTLDPGPTFRPR